MIKSWLKVVRPVRLSVDELQRCRSLKAQKNKSAKSIKSIGTKV